MFGIFKKWLGGTAQPPLTKALLHHAFLVDVRSAAEFASGSVKGAINIPVDELPHQLNKFKNKEHIVVFCRSGNRSSLAKHLLNKNGYGNVINGGTWQQVARAMD